MIIAAPSSSMMCQGQRVVSEHNLWHMSWYERKVSAARPRRDTYEPLRNRSEEKVL